VIQVHLAKSAVGDVELLLARSSAEFGEDARDRYSRLILAAITLIGRNPDRSVARDHIRAGLRTFHLGLARREARRHGPTVGKPRHLIVWKFVATKEILVVRVLHDAMELERHLPSDDEAES
jgi:toxin ParE1/3/4